MGIKTFDDLMLHVEVDEVSESKAVIILVHGLAEHLHRYDELAMYLNEEGYTTIRYDQRGHGHSENKDGKPVYIKSYWELGEDVHTMVKYAKGRYPTKKIYLIGHSMGGFSVFLYGTKYPGEVNGIITSGALTRGNNKGLFSFTEDMTPETYLPNALGGKVCTDAKVVEAYAEDSFVPKEISASMLMEMQRGVSYLKANAAQFRDSVLLLHGQEDGLVAEEDSRETYGEISSADKGLIIYPKLYHEIFNEPKKYDIYEDVISWLDERLG